MEYLWYQMCILQLCKGISWSMPVWSLFLAVSWFMSYVTKEAVEKTKEKLTSEE